MTIIRRLLCLLALLASAAAGAAGWQPVFQQGKFVGSLKTTASATPLVYSYPMTQDPTAYRPLYDAMYAVYTPLRSGWDAAVRAQLSGISQYRSHTASVSGPFRVTYTPAATLPGGRVSITAPTFAVTAKFHDSYLGLSVDCSATVSSGPVTLSADDLVTSTGLLIRPVLDMHPSRSVGCSSSLSWVPLIGPALDDLLTDRAEGLLGNLDDFVDKLQAQLPASLFFGLPTVPAGKFMLGGVDYGAYLVNNLPWLLSSGGFDLFVNDPYFREPRAYGWVTTERLSLSFRGANDGLSFSLYEQARYVKTWVCDPGRPCQQP